METYIPYPSFAASAEVLSASERVMSFISAMATLSVIHEVEVVGASQEYIKRHPMVRLWREHDVFLFEYADAMYEAMSPAVQGKLAHRREALQRHLEWATSGSYSMEPPRWLGDAEFHTQQQAALLRLNPEFYGPKFPDVSMTLVQTWPLG